MVARSSLLVIVAAACGSNAVRHIADAPPSDAPIDVAGPDAPPAAVELTVTAGPSGVAGLTVYFQDPDSTLESTATTDATGTATGMVKMGGFVTLAVPAPPAAAAATADRLVTWADVRPGDHLYIYSATGTTTVTFVIPVDSTRTPANYVVSTTCGAGTIPMPVATAAPPTMLSQAIPLGPCPGPQDMLVVGLDGNGRAVSSFAVAQQTFTNSGTLDLVGATYTAAESRTYTWNDDSDEGTLNMQDELQSTVGATYESVAIATAGTPPTITRNAPVFGTYRDVVTASMTVGTTQHAMAEWGQTGATYTGDWGAHRLPDITSAPTYDAATATVSWNTTGGAVQPNVTDLEITASRPADQGHAWDWTVLGNTGPVTLPTVPTTIYDWNIGAADDFSATVGLANVSGDPGDAREVFLGNHAAAAVEIGTAGVLSTASYKPPVAQPGTALPFFRR